MKKNAKIKLPIRVGVVGLGRAGIGMHLKEIAKFPDLFKVVAGCDVDASRFKIFKEHCPGAKTYETYADLLRDADVDLVSIATRSPDHTPHCLQALKSGKYVFLEKPIALSYREAKKLAKAAESYPGKLYLRHNRRFEPTFQHIREIMVQGILGNVYEIKLRRNGYQRRNDWQTIKACGGGQLNNWGPHIIDHALRLLDSPVKAVWSDLKRVAAVGDAEDHLKVIVTGENGRIVDLEISGGSALPEPTYIVSGDRGALVSDEKTITLKYLDPKVRLAKIKADPDSPRVDAAFGNAEKLVWIEKTIPVKPKFKCEMHHIWKHMANAILGKAEYPITLEEGVEVVRITELARKGTGF